MNSLKLRTKLLLLLLPAIVLPLLGLGVWSYQGAAQEIRNTVLTRLATVAQVSRETSLETLHALIVDNGLEQIPGFVRQYQRDALAKLERTARQNGVEVLVVDADGAVLHRPTTLSTEDASILAAGTGVAGRLARVDLDSGSFHLHTSDFPPWQWTLFHLSPADGMHELQQDAALGALGATLLALGACALIVPWTLRHSILLPVAELRQASRRIAAGAFPGEIAVPDGDELGTLARDMEEMARQLSLARENDRRWRETLEEEVAERTRELRENKEKYQDLLEATRTAPWEIDLASGRFTFVGRQIVDLLGYPLEYWTDMEAWSRTVHPEDRKWTWNFCSLETERCRDHEFTYRAVTADGRTVWISDLVSVVRGDHGPEKMVGFMHDVTEARKAEEERRTMEVRLRESQKLEAIGTLAGGVAHEFNNLLAVMMGFTQLALERAEPGSEDRDDLDEVMQAARRARDLVNQVLAFGRRDQEKDEPFAVGVVVKEALRLLRPTLPVGVEIEADVDPGVGAARGDSGQMQQVVMNLCTNACQAVDPEKGRIRVSVRDLEVDASLSEGFADLRPGPHVALTVADNGPGIPPDILPRIFEPFFTTKEVGSGSGMGLAVVHGIVKAHGGAIRVEASPETGTEFTVYLPSCPVREAVVPEAGVEELPEGSGRILVVDDEPALARMTGRMLTSLGYEAEVAHAGQEALDVLEQDPEGFDLVLTDQTMPGMSGAALTKRILALRPELPVVICTGYSEALDADRAQTLGARGFLYKPLEQSALAQSIRSALSSAA